MCFSTIDTDRLKAIKLTANKNVTKPCRPYTEYNIFFQLEREHILQVQLGFQPEYEPGEIFDPFDTSNYQGPPLPSRYNGLILLRDWHLPGKELRRKRRHRKTHGMIGFQELSLRIADSWKIADPDIRTYCAEMCDLGFMQHKSAMRTYKATYTEEDYETLSIKTLEDYDKKVSAARASVCLTATVNEFKPPLLDITPINVRYIPTERWSLAEVDAAFDNDLALSQDNLNESIIFNVTASSGDASLRCSHGSLAQSMVDIEDDEIIDMWQSMPKDIDAIKPVDEVAFARIGGSVISDFSLSSSQVVSPDNRKACQSINQESQDQNTTSPSFDPNGQNSHIDATMNDLKNMRNELLDQQIQLQSSIKAAMRITKGMMNKDQGHRTHRRFTAHSA